MDVTITNRRVNAAQIDRILRADPEIGPIFDGVTSNEEEQTATVHFIGEVDAALLSRARDLVISQTYEPEPEEPRKTRAELRAMIQEATTIAGIKAALLEALGLDRP